VKDELCCKLCYKMKTIQPLIKERVGKERIKERREQCDETVLSELLSNVFFLLAFSRF